jgi:membrane protease subunit HflK
LYLQTMESVFSRTSKVLMDAGTSGNVLYLPLDQLGVGGAARSGRNTMPPIITPDAGTAAGNSSKNVRNPRREGRQ